MNKCLVSVGSDQDGIQVDKIRHIGYKIPYQVNAMSTAPISSATLMILFRDNFSPSFVAFGAIGDHPLLYGSI